MHARPWLSLVLVVVALSAIQGACAEPTPEERVSMLRSRYVASLNSFLIEQRPVEEPPIEELGVEELSTAEAPETGEPETAEAEPEEAPASEEAGEAEPEGGEEGMEIEEPVELVQDILLDIVIRHDSPEKLDGITVDITMADGERELQTWRAWFDTSDLEKGPGTQYSHELEDVDYQEGYGFNAEIRHPVPPEERSEYREFSNLGG